MAEWIFFGVLIIAAIIVFVLLMRKKNRHKHIPSADISAKMPLLDDAIDAIDHLVD